MNLLFIQRPEVFALHGTMFGLPYFEQGVELASCSRPPDLEVIGERAGADLAKAVNFTKVFDGDNSRAHKL